MFTLPEEPRILKLFTCFTKAAGNSFSSTVFRNVRFTSMLEMTSLP